MTIFETIYALTILYAVGCIAWRIVCLFRKKGSCKFTNCPFRKDYTNTSCVYFPSGGCTKCPPTDEEIDIYSHSPEGIIENLKQKKDV